MKAIGLIGGMSWESSAEYYRIINETMNQKLGGYHSARIILYNLDFDEVFKLQHNEKWLEAANVIAKATVNLEKAGADCILICSNTGNEGADRIAARIKVPLLHIADVTATEVIAQGLKNVALLGTRFAMEKEYHRGQELTMSQLGLSLGELEG